MSNLNNNGLFHKIMAAGITQEEKRIRLAKAHGWKHHNNRASSYALTWESKEGAYHDLPPDYFGSLGAIMPVIRGLNSTKREDFINALVMIIAPASQWHDMHRDELFLCITATPEQLCEAAGATLNLW